ncbi:hypothetical protein CK203_103385 [Vitis vinifera]|uniref:Uncharacterized protein n=1 Tax=Vitis vinifera TaxID=29760 RepID=A0A438EJA5_VITVI|nr:hypothetical protein CK203_103385 [Vitis vinifera]
MRESKGGFRGKERDLGVWCSAGQGSADELQFGGFVEGVGGDAGEGDDGKHVQGGDGVWVYSDREEAQGRQIPPAGGVQGTDGASREAEAPQFGASPCLLPGQGGTPPRIRLLPQRQSLLPHSWAPVLAWSDSSALCHLSALFTTRVAQSYALPNHVPFLKPSKAIWNFFLARFNPKIPHSL